MPSEAVKSLFDHLWQSTVFGIGIWFLTLAFERNRAAIRHTLWLLASLKFLIPFSLLVSIGHCLPRPFGKYAIQPEFAVVVTQIGRPFSVPAAAWYASTPANPSATDPLPFALVAVWLLGFLAVGLPWFIRWRRVRAVVRTASPIISEFDAVVLAAPAWFEPGVFGIFRPVVLWPEGITERLAPIQLEAILAHELCHIRRRDNLAAAVHMLVEAMFWFHPLVWWIGARLVEERERACDEDVLRCYRAPGAYAQSILQICHFYVGAPLARMSRITGGKLEKRIVHIMTRSNPVKLDLARQLSLAVLAALTVTGPFLFGFATAPAFPTSLPPATDSPWPAFITASIKRDNSGSHHFSTQSHRGHLVATNVTLEDTIKLAYDVKDYQISGPDWLKTERFDIAAQAAPPTPRDRLRLMLRTLLAERFHLLAHREQKLLPVFELREAPLGAKLPFAKNDGNDSLTSMPGRVFAQKASLAQFSEILSHQTDRPVFDRTGLRGTFNFQLTWPQDEPQDAPQTTAASLFPAIRSQLGLILDPQMDSLDMLVIDRVQDLLSKK